MAYLDQTAASIRKEVPQEILPDEDGLDGLFRLYALLARAKGEAVSAEDVHDAWVVWMLERGEEHESLVPFDQLDRETQHEDDPFVRAIRTVAARSS
jgi:hypothetical protein